MSELQGLQNQLQEAKELVARRDIALKLGSNREFKKLILEDFVVNDAARFAAQSADPALDEKQQRDALSMAQAGGHLKRYLSAIVQMGHVAEREIPQIEEAIQEFMANEGDED